MYDLHAVAIIWGNFVLGHVLQNIYGFFCKLLSLPNISICAPVLVKRVNRCAGYGLKISVCFFFQGHIKGVEWIKKIDEAEKKVQARFEKWKMLFRTFFCYCITTYISRIFLIEFYVGRSTLVGQRPMKSLSSVCPSVAKFSQDWIIIFFPILYAMIADHDI